MQSDGSKQLGVTQREQYRDPRPCRHSGGVNARWIDCLLQLLLSHTSRDVRSAAAHLLRRSAYTQLGPAITGVELLINASLFFFIHSLVSFFN